MLLHDWRNGKKACEGKRRGNGGGGKMQRLRGNDLVTY